MDKLSNKLKLSRSQSMGVGMGGGGDKMPTNMRRNESGGSSGRQASIVLLDERRLEMHIQPRLYAGELLDLVASHIQLKEKEYFGLAVLDENGHYTWLQLDRKILDHDLPRKPATLCIHFLVKFFIESICHLAENKTIEMFYLQARSLIFRGSLEVDADIVFQLAALALQSSHGDHVDETTTRALIRKSPILPSNVLKDFPSMTSCEDAVMGHYAKTKGQTRGQAMVNYMTIVESMPTYGVHYFEVLDKRGQVWWLGLSCRGIAQYEAHDRKSPVRVFQWKQLENLYFRDKKFSIEVHDAKRVIQTVSSFNLYDDMKSDDLSEAITEATTQVSLSRRSYHPGNIHVYVWFGKTQTLTKCIWQSAISQHQFYLDRKQAKMRPFQLRTLKEIARDLTRSSLSLSSNSSECSNLSISLSGSTPSLAMASRISLKSEKDEQQLEEAKRLKSEMLAALKARREALELKLKEKNELLKELCIKEGELTGELPPEIPLNPGEPLPTIRKRVGTEFKLSEDLLKQDSKDGLRANLELELEIQNKITAAALKLFQDPRAAKGVKKQRKASYQQSLKRLQELETKIAQYKQKKPRSDLERPPQRGQSIPAGLNRPDPEEEDELDGEVDAAMSAPASPRKRNNSLQNSPQRPSGYVPASHYKSSYRSKQYPTFPQNPGIDAHVGLPLSPATSSTTASKTASPYRNKYEVPNLDSPVGLYNCPQQRTSQAFSSMDDLDALTASATTSVSGLASKRPQHSSINNSSSSPNLRKPYVMNHRYVLGQAREVMARVEAATASVLNNEVTNSSQISLAAAAKPMSNSMANRELPALPNTESRSMENLDALEASGLHGRSKMHYREIRTTGTGNEAPTATTVPSHNLHNTEEYPPHEMSSRKESSGLTGGPHHYPLPPSQRTSTTLLPGQTYPEQPAKPITSLQDVFYHRDNFRMALNTSTSSSSLEQHPGEKSHNPKEDHKSDSPPPPLYPKQYHAVVEQRRRSGLDRPTAVAVPAVINPVIEAVEAVKVPLESPAVDRRIKPKSSEESDQESFKFVPYVETTKPFEMSDFYKYSTKYKKSKNGSESSSTSSSNNDNNNTKPPELPAKNSPAKGGSAPPPPPPLPPPKKNSLLNGSTSSLADSFSSEMLQWYKNQQGSSSSASVRTKNNNAQASVSVNETTGGGPPGAPGGKQSNNSDKPATLV